LLTSNRLLVIKLIGIRLYYDNGGINEHCVNEKLSD